MNKEKLERYKALDRCLRRTHQLCDMNGLIEECTKALYFYHPGKGTVSRRTVENDLTELKNLYPKEFKLRYGLKDGRKKLYQYEDTSFSLMNKLLKDGTLEQMMLQNVIDSLTQYGYDDAPQYKWLKIFVELQMAGKGSSNPAVDFQYNPLLKGRKHFDDLLMAILKQQPIKIEYQKYHGDSRTYLVHPYLLKQYNDRWFFICRTDGFQNLTIFAIDRIQSIEHCDISFLPFGDDIKSYFEDVVGVSRDVREPVVDVKIRISNSRFRYVESKPLHSSQTTIHSECNDKYSVIRLRVQINNELEAQILSLGNDAEVIAPESLRNSIADRVKDLYRMYVVSE